MPGEARHDYRKCPEREYLQELPEDRPKRYAEMDGKISDIITVLNKLQE